MIKSEQHYFFAENKREKARRCHKAQKNQAPLLFSLLTPFGLLPGTAVQGGQGLGLVVIFHCVFGYLFLQNNIQHYVNFITEG
ncbi:hypothetical protein [Paenibacillus tengchongensis]|uniref:hypothetical protein n=1 Tax=Paenibacillus tengchongensis TaxID=2608684 RepID=UPI001FE6A9F9|nr:hypothetical protein [Paenibacillus tengchongensis]